MIWSSPPVVANTARIAGSAQAAIRSTARSAGVAPTVRVVGYSTGSSPHTSRIRRMACSCCAGYWPGAANDGETIATDVCKQAWFRDPDGNRLMLHRRFDA